MKKCPFCKSEISSSATECPVCTRVLVEKFPRKEPVKPQEPKVEYKKTHSYTVPPREKAKTYYQPTSDPTKTSGYAKSGLTWLIGSILLSVIVSVFTGGSSIDQGNVAPQVVQPSAVQSCNPAPNSLGNGTALYKKTILTGLGELTIKNGTASDAVVKLVDMRGQKSIYTVYIDKNNSYTIKDIPTGTYKVAFAFGSDWDNEKKVFNCEPNSGLFDNSFEYTVQDTDTSTIYSTYTLTLNPVVGGTAKTSDIGNDQFNSY